MINLLPPQGKKMVMREYRTRVASAYLLLVGVIMIMTGVLFMPSYFHVAFQKGVYQSQLGSSADLERLERIEEEFKQANLVSDLLLDTKQHVAGGEVLDVAWELSGEGVEVSDVQIRKEEGAVMSVTVSGTAENRDVLIRFRDDLKGHEYFSEVNLPISDLTKNEDIGFSITLTASEALTEPIVYEK